MRPIELHCVHNDGPVTVDADQVNEVRPIVDPKLGIWTRLRMRGSADVEIKEPYADVKALIFLEQTESIFPPQKTNTPS